MTSFPAADGTRLTCHVSGDGTPLICLPGGPMQASAYLDGLDGLLPGRRLVRLDLRGTGESEVPEDPGSYRCDRLVADVEALRGHLGLETADFLAHSAGANLAALYAARHPARVRRLVLITPSVFAVGIPVTGEDRLETARLRSAEPWFAPAYAALEGLVAGRAADGTGELIAPFWYGRWDGAARSHSAAGPAQKNPGAGAAYGAEGAFDPEATRAALAKLDVPVLLVAGEVDLAAPPRALAAYAELFPDAALTVQPGSGHFPWLDDPALFAGAVSAFLGRSGRR
ncbi:alpha/beta fold hydrolase [Streptomyces sp. NPDC096136]|uniref:alpha/beta fold hydrolase n=1 Tax=Streptomyces sp. NPDC096136 TaxID=3366076 RepID=UPI0037FAF613